jgi:dTDP-4-dehydrorhamnose 3,5-epimerase
MKIIETPISGLYVLEPVIHEDQRGCFLELYNSKSFKEIGISNSFVQENLSKSSYGVIRGLHFQKGEYAQAKLATVLKGCVYDVAVDLRKDSPTYGQWYGVELSESNKRLFFIPRGFAHGFSVLSKEAIFSYKCDNFYAPQSESGIYYNDPMLAIDWLIKPEDVIVSEQDNNRPCLKDLYL